jgi:hypothetical protein
MADYSCLNFGYGSEVRRKSGGKSTRPHPAVTVVVTVTVRKGPITGITVLPAAVGTGAEAIMIENAPRGIVIPEKLPVDVGTGAEGVTCDEASGT